MTSRKSVYHSLPRTRESSVLQLIGSLAPKNETSRDGLRLGIGDDAAVVKGPAGRDEILSCDWFLEGTHFLRDKHPPHSVGWKCLARALSDVAAMGGVPKFFLLSLALPASLTGGWLKAFLEGLRQASRKFSCLLVGGDTTEHDRILISVTVTGETRSGCAALRSGAKPGDAIYVSGTLGEAQAGLERLRASSRRVNRKDPQLRRHLYPEPRLALGSWLTTHRIANAMMDLSDGLSTDLARLCAASKAGAVVQSAQLPIVRTPRVERSPNLDNLSRALHGGDDYELLFTVPRRKTKLVPSSFQGLLISRIGQITPSRTILLSHDGDEQLLKPQGWDPFRQPKRPRSA